MGRQELPIGENMAKKKSANVVKFEVSFGRWANIRHASRCLPLDCNDDRWFVAVGDARVSGQVKAPELVASIRERAIAKPESVNLGYAEVSAGVDGAGVIGEFELSPDETPDDVKKLAKFFAVHSGEIPEGERDYAIYFLPGEIGMNDPRRCAITKEPLERKRIMIGRATFGRSAQVELINSTAAESVCPKLATLLKNFEVYHTR